MPSWCGAYLKHGDKFTFTFDHCAIWTILFCCLSLNGQETEPIWGRWVEKIRCNRTISQKYAGKTR